MTRFSRIERIAVTGSTNEDMARILGEERARGLTLVADHQHRGAGRKGRSWIAQPGTSLLCTIALPDAVPASDMWIAPFWIGVAIAQAIRELGALPMLQWPNDILLQGRKAGGILCISRVVGEFAWVACGVGINVTRPAEGMEQIVPPPAFLSDVVRTDRDRLLAAILRHADAAYEGLAHPDRVAHQWEIEAGIPGARYRVQLDDGSPPFEGSALRLLAGGSLLLDDRGRRREVGLADARVLR